jgi:hypothetical protein
MILKKLNQLGTGSNELQWENGGEPILAFMSNTNTLGWKLIFLLTEKAVQPEHS